MRHVNIVFNPRYPDIAELAEEIARDGVPHQAPVSYTHLTLPTKLEV